MPEVTAPNHRDLLKLSPADLLRRRIEGERELVAFHRQRAAEAEARQRDYETELAKLGAVPGDTDAN